MFSIVYAALTLVHTFYFVGVVSFARKGLIDELETESERKASKILWNSQLSHSTLAKFHYRHRSSFLLFDGSHRENEMSTNITCARAHFPKFC